jgi:hypothetical protein
MAQPTQPKRPYQPPSIISLRPYQSPSIDSVRVFLPMLAATTGTHTHGHLKQRLPFSPN